MKNVRFPLFGLALVLLIASCKKQDVKSPAASNALQSSSTTKASQWNSLTNWSSLTADSSTTFYTKMSDSLVTSDIVSNGLVLVYKKSGNDIESLPFQDKSNKVYWYYQVSKGSIRISGNNASSQNVNGQSFSYFIITPEKISALQSNGKTKLDLMQLSYDQAAALLK